MKSKTSSRTKLQLLWKIQEILERATISKLRMILAYAEMITAEKAGDQE